VLRREKTLKQRVIGTSGPTF